MPRILRNSAKENVDPHQIGYTNILDDTRQDALTTLQCVSLYNMHLTTITKFFYQIQQILNKYVLKCAKVGYKNKQMLRYIKILFYRLSLLYMEHNYYITSNIVTKQEAT